MENSKPWGYHTIVDLYNCDSFLISDYNSICNFAIKLTDLIGMKRFKDPIVERFGENPDVTGYSLVQLIETSNVCAHFAEKTNSAYIDIFSCKEYNIEQATQFCIDFFKAQDYERQYLERY